MLEFFNTKDLNIRSFYLSSAFLDEYVGEQPKWGFGGVGYFVYKRTYARPLSNGDTEEWWQTCRRVVEGVYNVQKIHCKRFGLPWNDRKAQNSAQEMFRRMWDFKFLPPGRGLWAMGTDVMYLKGSAALNNCGFVSTKDISVDFAAPFCFLMDMSMLGVGVGGDCRGSGTITIDKVTKMAAYSPDGYSQKFLVKDSREGWVDALRHLLNAFVGKHPLREFSYKNIRPEGAPIKGFGGTASGPGPLKEMLDSICSLLENHEGQKITSGIIVDIFNLVGKCVVAGGVRRTAEIMFSDPSDKEFLGLKDPTELDKWKAAAKELKKQGLDKIKVGDKEEPTPEYTAIQKKINAHPLVTHRWASNNSVFGEVGMNYDPIIPSIQANGEPGIIWLDTMRKFGRLADPPNNKDERAMGCNPCSEQTLESFELCCLVETFPAHHEDLEDYKKTLKFAYLYAKTVTLIPTHDSRVNAVMLRNRRIGCSMTGITQAIAKFGRHRFFTEFCNEGYKYIQTADKYYSEWLCIPRSIKMTSVKPSGTVSLLCGATAGIHYAHSKYYIRRVTLQNTSPLLQAVIDAGYPVEDYVYDKKAKVVEFPVMEEHFIKGKDQVSIYEQFMNAADMQYWWADNQVSVTVTFRKDEQDDIIRCLEYFDDKLKSVSLLPLKEHGYAQAPYEEITKEEYEHRVNTSKPLVLKGNTHEVDDKFCDGDTCAI